MLVAYRDHGNRPAFEELVHRYERELYGYLRNYLGDADMAEDVFQQTFLQVYLEVRPVQAATEVSPLALRGSHQPGHRLPAAFRPPSDDEPGPANEPSATRRRTALLANCLIARSAGPAEESQSLERAGEVRRAVDELPEQTKQVVLLVYFQGLKYREAAHVLGVPLGTVKSRLHGAIQKLGEVLTAEHPPAGYPLASGDAK